MTTSNAKKKKGAKKRRRMPGPFRKVIPQHEKRTGYVLLVLLLGIGAVIVWKRAYTNRAIFEAVTPEPRRCRDRA